MGRMGGQRAEKHSFRVLVGFVEKSGKFEERISVERICTNGKFVARSSLVVFAEFHIRIAKIAESHFVAGIDNKSVVETSDGTREKTDFLVFVGRTHGHQLEDKALRVSSDVHASDFFLHFAQIGFFQGGFIGEQSGAVPKKIPSIVDEPKSEELRQALNQKTSPIVETKRDDGSTYFSPEGVAVGDRKRVALRRAKFCVELKCQDFGPIAFRSFARSKDQIEALYDSPDVIGFARRPKMPHFVSQQQSDVIFQDASHHFDEEHSCPGFVLESDHLFSDQTEISKIDASRVNVGHQLCEIHLGFDSLGDI